MKNFLIVLLLVHLSAFCQEPNWSKDCRELHRDALNSIYRHDFNAYLEDDNLAMDIDFQSTAKSTDITNSTIETLKEKSKETIYDIIKNWINSKSENEICKLKFYVFNVNYVYSDKKRFIYTYYIDVDQLMKIKDNLNRKAVYEMLLRKE